MFTSTLLLQLTWLKFVLDWLSFRPLIIVHVGYFSGSLTAFQQVVEANFLNECHQFLSCHCLTIEIHFQLQFFQRNVFQCLGNFVYLFKLRVSIWTVHFIAFVSSVTSNSNCTFCLFQWGFLCLLFDMVNSIGFICLLLSKSTAIM